MAGVKGLLLAAYYLSGALCRNYSVKMPTRIEALDGSCVLIPCALNLTDAHHLNNAPTGIWIKHGPQFANRENTVVFNSSEPKGILSGEIIGALAQKNCTTVLGKFPTAYSDKYYFRIETSTFRATFPETPVYINFRGFPKKPNITKSNELKEGTPVSLKCLAAAPCVKSLPVLEWTPNFGEARSEVLENSDKTQLVASVLTFTPQQHSHHERIITCSAEYTLENRKKIKVEDNMALQVLFPPKNTTAFISPSGSLLEGSPVNLTCESSANPPVNEFVWFRSAGIRNTRIGTGRTIAFNASSGDVGWYYCEAGNSQGTQRSGQVKLTIEGAWDSLALPLIGGIVTVGLILAFLVLLIFWRWRKSREKCISTSTTSPEGQGNLSPDPSKAVETREPTSGSESQQEELQYAQIEFSKQRAKETSNRGEEDSRDQGQIEYAEVQFSGRKQKSPIEDVYSQVKREKRHQ